MIKNLPDFNKIKSMSYDELVKLRRSLKEKIKVRKTRYKKEVKIAEATAERIPNPQTALEQLEVQGDAFTAKSTNFEATLLQTYLDEVEKYYNKYIEMFNSQQPGE